MGLKPPQHDLNLPVPQFLHDSSIDLLVLQKQIKWMKEKDLEADM